MLFGDSGRSGIAPSSRHPEVAAVRLSNSTQNHIGPGAYHTAHNENIRSGWVKRSYSTRQPMAPGSSPRKGRYANYTNGVLVGSGLAEGGRDSNSTPGPGHYNIMKDIEPVRHGTDGPFNSTANGKRYPYQPMSSGSPRILLPSSSMKNGVLFEGKHEEHNTIGPGHYGNVDEGKMLKKSFNVRASEGNSPRKRSMTSPRSPRGRPDHYDNSPQARSWGSPTTPMHDYYSHVEGESTPFQYQS